MSNNKRRSGLYNDRRAYRQNYSYEAQQPICPPMSLNIIATLTNGIYVLNKTTTILECQTLTIPMVTQLSIPNGLTLTNNGTIVIGNTSLITIGGVLINSGTITNELSGGGQINNNGTIQNLLTGIINLNNTGNGGFGIFVDNNGIINNSSSTITNNGLMNINSLKNNGSTVVTNNKTLNILIGLTNDDISIINNNKIFNIIRKINMPSSNVFFRKNSQMNNYGRLSITFASIEFSQDIAKSFVFFNTGTIISDRSSFISSTDNAKPINLLFDEGSIINITNGSSFELGNVGFYKTTISCDSKSKLYFLSTQVLITETTIKNSGYLQIGFFSYFTNITTQNSVIINNGGQFIFSNTSFTNGVGSTIYNINSGLIDMANSNTVFINNGIINNPQVNAGCGTGTIDGNITNGSGSIGTACPPP